jgi:hypothetical protein
MRLLTVMLDQSALFQDDRICTRWMLSMAAVLYLSNAVDFRADVT